MITRRISWPTGELSCMIPWVQSKVRCSHATEAACRREVYSSPQVNEFIYKVYILYFVKSLYYFSLIYLLLSINCKKRFLIFWNVFKIVVKKCWSHRWSIPSTLTAKLIFVIIQRNANIRAEKYRVLRWQSTLVANHACQLPAGDSHRHCTRGGGCGVEAKRLLES